MTNRPDPLEDPRFTEVVARLRGQEMPEPSADFTARTMARLWHPPARSWTFAGIAARAAAVLAFLLASGLWFVRTPIPRAESPPPIDVLMAAQRSDGGWSADERNLRSRYDVGVTALALLALMHVDTAPLEGPLSAAVRAGVAHLLLQQHDDGRFGEDFSGAKFTQYLAGMALQTAAQLPGTEAAWRIAADRAEQHLPSRIQMAKLNGNLAHPEAFPPRWADVGGPVTLAALEMLKR